MQIITPKSTRKAARRDAQLFAQAQINKIREYLDGIIREHETPAQCVKRLVEALHPRGNEGEQVVEALAAQVNSVS